MDFLMNINWFVVFMVLGVAIILWNSYQLVRFIIIKNKAEKEMKELNAKIASINKQIEDAKKSIVDQINKTGK